MMEPIGPYEITRELGRGGMGVVYLAQDSRLGRLVAIKALPDHLSQDAERLARFEREARTLASISHPNIAGIHGLEVQDERRYLVLEFVEGDTLAERLERGPMPVDEALGFALQIADALDAAHEKGVVHRDLKPGNVIVTPEGQAKVLDFGLARTANGSASSSRHDVTPDSPTIESPAPLHSPTIPGAIMGTAGYMSPEQARGRAVDKRSDIFSFGCVLYEMLTGMRPFAGDTVADVLGATLHKDLDLNLLPPSVPERVRDLLVSCLAKERKDRLHDIADARITLKRAIDGREWTLEVGAHRQVRRKPVWSFVAIAAALCVAMAVVGWFVGTVSAPTPPPPSPIRMLIPSSTPEYTQAGSAVISRDGQSIAFSARARGSDRWTLWVRRLDSFDAKQIPETEDAGSPFWSWDSRSIAFNADGKLWAIELESGGARRLIVAEFLNSAAWGPGGDILGVIDGRGEWKINRIAPGSGVAEPITTLDRSAFEAFHLYPHFLPDGNRFLFLSVTLNPDREIRTGQLKVGRLDSPETTTIGSMLSAVWYVEPGWLVYVEDGAIKAAPFDQKALKITGESITIGDDVSYFKPIGASLLSASPNGSIVYEPPSAENEIVWFGLGGERLGSVGAKGSIQNVRLSPDGSRAVVSVTDRRTGGSDLWIYGIDRPTASRLTSDARWEAAPVWSADGSTVYFSWDKSDAPWIYSIAADGSGAISEVYGRDSGGSVWIVSDVSRDGSRLLVSGTVDKLSSEMRILDPNGKGDGKGDAQSFRSTAASEFAGRFSPDGNWIAYFSDKSGRDEIYLAPADGTGRAVQVSVGGAWSICWAHSGDALYYLTWPDGAESNGSSEAGTALMVVDLASPEAFRSPPPPRVQFESRLSIDSIEIANDGKRFLGLIGPTERPMIRVMLNSLPASR